MIPSLSVTLALALVTPQEPRVGSDVVSVQHLLAAPPSVPAPLWDTLLVEEGGQSCLLAAARELAPGRLLEPLQALNRDALDAGRLLLNLASGNLLLAGTEPDLARVRTQVQLLSRTLTRSVQIELTVWDATDRATPACVLDAAAYAAFAQNRPQLWRVVGTTADGQTLPLSRLRWTSYVRSINGEVAQKATISDPVLDRFAEGVQAIVRPFAISGADEFVLHSQFALAQRRGIVRQLQTGVAGAPDIEIPTLETSRAACSARLPNGGAMAITLRGHAALGGQVVITVRASAAPLATTADREFAVFPCGALTDRSLLRENESVDANGQKVAAAAASCGSIPEELLADLVAAAIGEGGGSHFLLPGHVIVRGDSATQGRVASLLRSLQDRVLRTVTVTVTGALPIPNSEDPAPASTTAPILHELAAPTLLGRELRLARLLETNVVRDLEVQIAQDASMIVPIVDALQVGTWVNALAGPAEGTLLLDLELRCCHAAASTARNIMPNGVITPTDVNGTMVSHRGLVTNGQPIDHGDGPMLPVEGRSWRSSMQTTLRW